MCPACRLAWGGDKRVKPRSQASLAVSADGENWTLINASPDLRAQLMATPPLRPRGEARGSPIAAVVLTGAEVDQIAGLLTLRERQPFALFATAQTHAALDANPIFGVLAADVVTRNVVATGQAFRVARRAHGRTVRRSRQGAALSRRRRCAARRSKTAAMSASNSPSDARRLVYVPGAAAMTAALQQRLASADVVLFDATLFADDEMIAAGIGEKTGRRMGHMPLDRRRRLAGGAGQASRPAHLHPHQQHQPDSDRRLAGTA